MKVKQQTKAYTVALPADAHGKLVAQAKRERRMIRVVLETAIDQYVERYDNENPKANS